MKLLFTVIAVQTMAIFYFSFKCAASKNTSVRLLEALLSTIKALTLTTVAALLVHLPYHLIFD